MTCPCPTTAPPLPALLGPRPILVPVFEVQVSRRIWIVTEGDAEIEVVLDQGLILAGDRQSPVSEIELELRSGPPRALFDLARRLQGAAPLQLGVRTKAERGHRLTEARPVAVKAGAVPLTPDLTAAAALQAGVQACRVQFRANEDLLFPTRQPEALHQMRVALRRLRSAFSIFGQLLGADKARDLRDRLRRLAAGLGPARDLDVLLDRARPGPLRDRLRGERERAYDHAAQVLGQATTRALMLDLVEWTHCGAWLDDPATLEARDEPARRFAARALDRLRRKVKKGGRNLSAIDDEARHALRKDAKKLRYAAEFFAPLFDAPSGAGAQAPFMAALKDLQDRLGVLNDLSTAPLVLDRLGIADDPEAAYLLRAGKPAKLLKASIQAQKALIGAEPYWR